jgi:neutral ceramidase
VNEIGDSLAARAIGIYERAGKDLHADLRLTRSFRTVQLIGPGASPHLCPEPQVGAGAAAGSEGSQSNLKDWKVLGLFPLYAKEGAVDKVSGGCQAPKRELPWILRLGLGDLHLPTQSQLMVVQIGDLVAAAVPVEMTTEVGFRIRAAMLRTSSERNLGARATVVVGLANGYMQYVATREEYQAQHYEGGSTLYGPGFAEYLQDEIVELTAQLSDRDYARVEPISGDPGARRKIFPRSRDPRPEHLVVKQTRCESDTVTVRWLDAPPGSLLPSDGPMLELRRSRSGEEPIVTWDDDRFVEVRGIESGGRGGYLWEVRWTPPGGTRGDYSVTFLRWPVETRDRGFRCP